MKKIFFTLIAFIVAIAASAQERTIKVYGYDSDGNLNYAPLFISAEKVKVVFSEENHEYVDLGLRSGTLWATCNVGASKPEEYGDYFAWGEIEPKSQYDEYKWGTYKWCEGSEFTMTKYCEFSEHGTVDNKRYLRQEDDAATANWGGDWCMPTYDQLYELVDPSFTYTEWTTLNGVNGIKITSYANGNSIFLPATGYRHYRALDGAGSEIFYWSRSLAEFGSFRAHQLNFVTVSDVHNNRERNRYYGQPIRPVRVKK